jgi:ribonuclease R
MEVTIAVNTHHIPHQWGDDVLQSVRTLTEEVAEADKKGRRDLRALKFVTIDGVDARDFDDAVYCEPLAKGYRLYVLSPTWRTMSESIRRSTARRNCAAPRFIFRER